MYDIEEILKKTDKEFIKFIGNNDDFISNDQIFQRILNLSKIDFLNLIIKFSDEILISFLNNKNFINMNDSLLATFFLKNNNKLKKEIINNDEYLKRILKITPNSVGRTPFDLSEEEIKTEILNKKEIIDSIDKNLFYKLLQKLDNKEFEKIVLKLDNSKLFSNYKDIKTYLKVKYDLKEDDFLTKMIIDKFNNKKRSPYYLLKINNVAELLIYEKFNLLVEAKIEKNNLVFKDGNRIDYDFINNINKKHVKSIIDYIKMKETDINSHIILISALKLYGIFGYDNSKKILENKFTYLTNSALDKIAEIEFVSGRRKHRIKNQDRFYNHQMVSLFIEKAMSNDVDYFKYILGDYYKLNINQLIDEISKLKLINDNNESLKTFIKQIINERERIYKQEFINNYKKSLKATKIRSSITIKEIYNLFSDFDLFQIELDEKGKLIENKELTQFLLGNYKNDNDCLLRLILNDKADGIKDTLISIINDFEIVKDIVEKSNGKLSLNSVLDLIEISKTFLYNMAPNEKDLQLESIAKILKSSKYCEELPADIFLRAKELHVLKKEKIYSSIPLVESSVIDDIKCKIMEFDDESLITIGISTDSCLKIGSKGEDFLKYCVTNPNSIIIQMKDKEDNIYICPFVRNGNTIYGNGIDPKPKDEIINKKLMNCLEKFTQKILENSDKDEKLEFAVITDLHQAEYLENSTFQEITLPKRVIIDSDCYTDFNKHVLKHEKPLKNYIISKTKDKIEFRNYLPGSVYYQKRNPNFICTHNEDKSIIEDMINSIYYSNIDYKDISIQEKNSQKRNYQELKVDDYKHIIGNKDWFIAIDDKKEITSCLLPYDKRAREEYKEALKQIKNQNIFKEEVSLCKGK